MIGRGEFVSIRRRDIVTRVHLHIDRTDEQKFLHVVRIDDAVEILSLDVRSEDDSVSCS
jgi:YbbR domain-containing protein